MLSPGEPAGTGYEAVLVPYDKSGPNSTLAVPAHGLSMVYCATKGFCVLLTDTDSGGSFKDRLAHPMGKLHKVKIGNKTTAFRSIRFIFDLRFVRLAEVCTTPQVSDGHFDC
jgi:hypothetical protein